MWEKERLLNLQQYILLRKKRGGQGCQNTKYTVKGEVVKCDKTLIARKGGYQVHNNAKYGDRSLHIQGSVSTTKPNPRPVACLKKHNSRQVSGICLLYHKNICSVGLALLCT